MEFRRKEFHEFLDTGGPTVIFGDDYYPSEIVSHFAREKYEDGFAEWLAAEARRYVDRAMEIVAHFDQADRFDLLKKAYTANKLVPFVGAGLSVPCGYPGWSKFLWQLQAVYLVAEKELDLLLCSGDFERAAQLLHDDLGQPLFDERLQSTFDKRFVACGPAPYLPLLFPGHVVTTNFDRVLETVFEGNDQGFDKVLLGNQLVEAPRLAAEGVRLLIKVHGSCDLVANRVVLLSEYERAYVDGGSQSRFFEVFIFGHSLLFLGCSLATDRTIQKMAAVVSNAPAAALPRHFAIIELIDPASRAAREKALAAANIFPIWYPKDEYDESIIPLIVALAEEA